MYGWTQRCFLVCLFAQLIAPQAFGQPIDGEDLSFRSSGDDSGNDWVLDENGYVGTFFTLDAPGEVTLTVNATGSTSDAVVPHMNIVVADTQAGFDVGGGFADYLHSFDLPAGTYFVRTEFANDVPTANRQLTIRSLDIQGATSVSNTGSTSSNNANALAAADTYIEHFRQGPAIVALLGAAPGTPVEVTMVRNAFNFGTMVQGFDADVFLAPVAPGDTASIAARYQDFINNHFNSLVPSNMGKWQPNENFQNVPTMDNVDTILNYAHSHNMSVRMHNLIWGNQQPGWVNNLIDDAQSANPTVAAQAKADLMTAIANRIAYYVGDGDGDTNDRDRSQQYVEVDVLNEARREGTYWDIFGAEGIAEIHKMVKDAVEAAGADTRLYTNEYNLLQYSNDPDGGGSDTYANWYRRNVEEINNAGFGEVVTGIGIQYAADARTFNAQVHSAARIQQVLQNLSVTGLPISLTEFSVQTVFGGVVATEERSAEIYNESLRMFFGTPQATSFLIWEPWPPANTDNTTIVDDNWNLRASGEALVELLDTWTTPTQFLRVGADGTVDFEGFYGLYEITVGDETLMLDFQKGTPVYSLLTASFLAGDYNADGIVNAEDYVVWRNNQGTENPLPNDAIGGAIGQLQYNQWASNYGATPANASLADRDDLVVPEPAPIVLLSVLPITLLRRKVFMP